MILNRRARDLEIRPRPARSGSLNGYDGGAQNILTNREYSIAPFFISSNI
ncbi:MAG: hypothetical protein NTZ12_11825 [Candidatus Aminicenantes bacterium]|nr:hypothetical protein [Candidatus Aminicenantes bacterium]